MSIEFELAPAIREFRKQIHSKIQAIKKSDASIQSSIAHLQLQGKTLRKKVSTVHPGKLPPPMDRLKEMLDALDNIDVVQEAGTKQHEVLGTFRAIRDSLDDITEKVGIPAIEETNRMADGGQ